MSFFFVLPSWFLLVTNDRVELSRCLEKLRLQGERKEREKKDSWAERLKMLLKYKEFTNYCSWPLTGGKLLLWQGSKVNNRSQNMHTHTQKKKKK